MKLFAMVFETAMRNTVHIHVLT